MRVSVQEGVRRWRTETIEDWSVARTGDSPSGEGEFVEELASFVPLLEVCYEL